MSPLKRFPHLPLLFGLAVITASIALMAVTHFNLAAVIPLSVVFSAIPLAISSSCQDIVKSVMAGEQLRAEGILCVGMTVRYQDEDCKVQRLRLRFALLTTARGRKIAPYSQLLAGYEIIDHSQGDTHAA